MALVSALRCPAATAPASQALTAHFAAACCTIRYIPSGGCHCPRSPLRRTVFTETTRNDPKTLSNWEEIHMHTPRVAQPEAFEWPKRAPHPLETSRERFHEFMRGRPIPVPVTFGRNMVRNFNILIFVGLTVWVHKILRGDDFDWVDEERRRLAKARRKLDRLKARQVEMAAAQAEEERHEKE